MRQTVRGVRAVELSLADPDRAADFYAQTWNLIPVSRENGSYYLRGSCAYHHILAIHPSAGKPLVKRVIYDCVDREMVGRLHTSITAAGVATETPHELSTPGGGYGFGFQDPTGRAQAIVTGVDDHADDERAPDCPYKIAHVNFNDREGARLRDFFVQAMGFRLVDHAGQQFFLNADSPDHSSVVVCQSTRDTLNHLSFEMRDLDAVMRGAGRMQDAGYPIEWGIGRHGAAENVFAYFAGPEEMPLEYTSDVLQIDETYPFNGPEHWKWPPGRLDQWGVTPPHTRRWKRIQDIFSFGTDFHLSAREA
jgi:catechol-2,3-dioxygenase